MQNIRFHADDYGYSANISQNILDCLKSKTIQEMSIMIDSDEKLLQKIQDMKLKNISLHLNLTSLASVGNTHNSKFLKQLTFFKLFFLKNSKKTICKEEISHQIEKYKRFFPDVKLHIDGHHHIQIIPWIFTFLQNNKDFKIDSIRIPNEKIIFLSFSYLINLT
ncbi:MAG: ChbG/HpnK family deacetylase, partial [Flavobacteriales bacterium]|nr:ChbG/HpnK family deacetylase [Flavobacteriales bacterium]